jgi:hypothetical protein
MRRFPACRVERTLDGQTDHQEFSLSATCSTGRNYDQRTDSIVRGGAAAAEKHGVYYAGEGLLDKIVIGHQGTTSPVFTRGRGFRRARNVLIETVAVLPFSNLSSDPEQTCDGISNIIVL